MAPSQTGTQELKLFEIYEHIHVPFWQTKAFFIGLIVLGLLICSMLMAYAIKRYRSRKVVLPAWQVALRDLSALKKSNKITVAHGKECYSVMTIVLKKYFSEHYNFDNYEKTDEEFLHYIEKATFPAPVVSDLQTIFSGSTTIKFANMQAAQDQIENDFIRAVALVKQTANSGSPAASDDLQKNNI